MLLVIVNNTKGTTKVNIIFTNKSPSGEMVSMNLSLANTPIREPTISASNTEIENPYFFKIFI